MFPENKKYAATNETSDACFEQKITLNHQRNAYKIHIFTLPVSKSKPADWISILIEKQSASFVFIQVWAEKWRKRQRKKSSYTHRTQAFFTASVSRSIFKNISKFPSVKKMKGEKCYVNIRRLII